MSTWTDARVETLKTLWLDGFSASQVAASLGGGVTRNAVIGKVHRLGLSGRGAPTAPQRVTRRPPRPILATKPCRPPVVDAPRLAPARPALICEDGPGAVAGVEGLDACRCKWPLGDPRSESFSFCGQVVDHGPYCARHTAASIRPGAAAAAKSDRRLIGYLRHIGAIAA